MKPDVKDSPAVKEGEVSPKTDDVAVGDIVTPVANKDKQIAQDQRKRAEKAEAEKSAADSVVSALQEEVAKLKNAGVTGEKSVLQVNDELRRLSMEHNIDETFLASLVSTVRSATTKEIREELEKDYSPKITKIESERSQEKMDVKFNELYANVLADMPEYKNVVNKNVIKTLVFNPENAKKTLPQIVEEVYGASIAGKKSIELSRGSREQESPNLSNPSKEDWDKIESDPKAHAAWAKSTEEQIKAYL